MQWFGTFWEGMVLLVSLLVAMVLVVAATGVMIRRARHHELFESSEPEEHERPPRS